MGTDVSVILTPSIDRLKVDKILPQVDHPPRHYLPDQLLHEQESSPDNQDPNNRD